MHLTDPMKLIQTIHDHLTPGGIFACESIILGHEFCYLQIDAFNRWRELNHDVFKAMGQDPQTGKKLYHMMHTVGFHDLSARLFQPVLTTAKQRQEMIIKDLKEQEQVFIEFGLSTPK